MNSKQVKERLFHQRDQKMKKQQNRFLKRFLLVFLTGYFIFFTSFIWLPETYTNVSATKIGEELAADDRTAQLLRWDYAEEQELMEVIIQIDNQALDGIEKYEWNAVDRKRGSLKIKPIIQQDDFVVLHLSRIPRGWTEISLRMEIPKMAERNEEEILKMYANKRTIHRVATIKEKVPQAYQREITQDKIVRFENRIVSFEKKISNKKAKIAEADKKISELEEKMKYQTDQEMLNTQDQIYAFEMEKEAIQDKINEYNDEIKEYTRKIIKAKEQLKSMEEIL